jgi:hypothetical protein
MCHNDCEAIGGEPIGPVWRRGRGYSSESCDRAITEKGWENKLKRARFDVCEAITTENGVFWNIKPSSHLTGGTLRLRYRAQPVNAMLDLRFSWR